MDWQEDIKKFNLPHAKIMYMIYYFNKKNFLNDKEKLKLKEYVILEDETVFKIMDDFENLESDEDQTKEEFLLSQFKQIYKEEKKYFTKKIKNFEIVTQFTPSVVLKNENVIIPSNVINEINNKIIKIKDDKTMTVNPNLNIDSKKNQYFINVITSSSSSSKTIEIKGSQEV